MKPSSRTLYEQVMVIFGVLMTFFYFGIGIFFIMTQSFPNMEKFIRYFIGGMFVFYGFYRALQSYHKIKELFFTQEDEQE